MVQALRMPMMGNTMETGLLAEWRAEEGDPVEADQVVAVVESEKAAADVVANQDGTLARIDVREGEEVPPGTLVGVVLGPDEDIADAPSPRSRVEPGGKGGSATVDSRSESGGSEPNADGPGPADGDEGPTGERVRAAPGARRLAGEEGIDLDAVDGSGPDGAVLVADVEEHVADAEVCDADREAPLDDGDRAGRAFLPPSARRLARELGVDLERVEGTGERGRVTESDVRRAAGLADADAEARTEGRPQATPTETDPIGIAGPPPRDPARFGVTVTEERELSGVRRTVAERMTRSAREAPQVTLNREVAVERAFETAEELAAADAGAVDAEGEIPGPEADVGFTDLLVGAAVRALERHPEFNAWYEGGAHRLLEEVNVAVAVDAEAGLLTPVVREANRRTLADVARERRRLTDAVLEGRHGMDDLRGGTFTVSNLGPFGVDSFDPILDPPQVAILGVGRVRDGTCTLSLTFDHRVIDGADAARFLDALAGGLESPSVVVAERTAAGRAVESGTAAEAGGAVGPGDVTGPGPESGSGLAPGVSSDGTVDNGDVEAAVASDIAGRAREVAATHDWPVPSFEVRIGGERPLVRVRAADGGDGVGDTSPATLRRLVYAACRESRYADTIAGLRDPEIDLDVGTR